GNNIFTNRNDIYQTNNSNNNSREKDIGTAAGGNLIVMLKRPSGEICNKEDRKKAGGCSRSSVSAGVDVDSDDDEEDGEEGEEEDGVDEDGDAARLHVDELHYPPLSRQLEQQPRRQQHEQQHRHHH
ncbi:unnamed protein product, partial [Musa acuminata subsp. burmannicoides]